MKPFDLVTKEIETNRHRTGGWKEVDQTTSDRELAWILHQVGARPAGPVEPSGELGGIDSVPFADDPKAIRQRVDRGHALHQCRERRDDRLRQGPFDRTTDDRQSRRDQIDRRVPFTGHDFEGWKRRHVHPEPLELVEGFVDVVQMGYDQKHRPRRPRRQRRRDRDRAASRASPSRDVAAFGDEIRETPNASIPGHAVQPPGPRSIGIPGHRVSLALGHGFRSGATSDWITRPTPLTRSSRQPVASRQVVSGSVARCPSRRAAIDEPIPGRSIHSAIDVRDGDIRMGDRPASADSANRIDDSWTPHAIHTIATTQSHVIAAIARASLSWCRPAVSPARVPSVTPRLPRPRDVPRDPADDRVDAARRPDVHTPAEAARRPR